MNNEQKIAFEADEATFGFLEAVKMHHKNLTKAFFDTRSPEEILLLLREMGPVGYDPIKEMVFCSYYERLPERAIIQIGKDYGYLLHWLNFPVAEHYNVTAEILLLQFIEEQCAGDSSRIKEAYAAMPKQSWIGERLLRKIQKAIA